MTTTPPPFDELVSAYLDGEATADEVARVESTPELMAEVDRLQALTSRIASAPAVPPAPVAQREAHLAAALAAFDAAAQREPAAGAPETTPSVDTTQAKAAKTTTAPAEVVSLSERRSSRSWPRGRVLGIAAAVALFVVGAAALFSLNNGSVDRFETADAVDYASDAASDTTSAATSTTATEASEPVESLAPNVFDSDEALADQSRLEVTEAAEAMEAAAEEAMEEEETAGNVAGDAMDDDAADDAMDDNAADDAMAEDEPAASAAPESSSAGSSDAPSASGFDVARFSWNLSTEQGNALWIGPVERVDQISELLEQRASQPSSTLRTRCQLEILELDASATPTLVGLASLSDLAVEIHQLPGAETLLLVDANSCVTIDEITAPN